jgi:WD40 repeat protein
MLKNKPRKPKLMLKILAVIGLVMMFCLNLIAQEPRLVVQTGHSLSVNSVAFSPNGKILADGSYDGTIKLWDIKTGREIRRGRVKSCGNGKKVKIAYPCFDKKTKQA